METGITKFAATGESFPHPPIKENPVFRGAVSRNVNNLFVNRKCISIYESISIDP